MAIEVSPNSLFGKHPYGKEQSLIRDAVTEIERSIIFVSPRSAALPIPLQRLPADLKRRKIKEHLTIARQKLEELGV